MTNPPLDPELGLPSLEQPPNKPKELKRWCKSVHGIKAKSNVPTDVFKLPDAIAFEMELPGVKFTDVKAVLKNGNKLKIRTAHKRKEAGPELKYVRLGRSMIGMFYLKLTLDDQIYNLKDITVSYVDGVLTLTVPKVFRSPPSMPKTIEVTLGVQ